MAEFSEILAALLTGAKAEPERGLGPEKWCKRCSRKHRARAGCGLTQVAIPAKSGQMVKRQAHA